MIELRVLNVIDVMVIIISIAWLHYSQAIKLEVLDPQDRMTLDPQDKMEGKIRDEMASHLDT